MNARSFYRSLAVLASMLIILNLGLHLASPRTQRGHLLARLDSVPLDTECLFVGNSLVEAGVDPVAFAGSWKQEPALKTVNLALGGTSPVEHYLILRQAYKRPIHPRLIIYGFIEDQLNSAVQGDFSDLLGNRAFSYYFPSEAAQLYYPFSAEKRAQLQLVSHLPMLAERSTLWAKVERIRRRLGELGLRHKAINHFGRVEDFAALERGEEASFDKRCESALKKRTVLCPSVQALVELARKHGALVVLVEMPMPSHHQKLIHSLSAWGELQRRLESCAVEQRARYISAADWVSGDDQFQDQMHLNALGAKVFSARLARVLSTPPGVLPSVQSSEKPKIALNKSTAPVLRQVSERAP